MENWSYRAKEFWLLHRREIKRYGFCVLLVYAGLAKGIYGPCWMGVGGALILWAYDRWGAPLAERGRLVMERRKTNPPTA